MGTLQFLKFISSFDTKFLGLNFDVGHFFCVGENPADSIKDLRDYINHIHLEDIAATRIHKHLIPGCGAINFKDVFNAIEKIDYNGYVTVELYPYQNKPEEAAKTAIEFLESC